jgi:hypothetical protein
MDDSRLYLVFEFVPMDLKKFIDTRPKKHLDEITTTSFTYQVSIYIFMILYYIYNINNFKCIHLFITFYFII